MSLHSSGCIHLVQGSEGALPGLHVSMRICLRQHALNVGSEVSDGLGMFSP